MSLLLSSAALSLLAVLAVWLTGRRDPAQSPLLTLVSLLALLALPALAFLPKLTVDLPALAGPAPESVVSNTVSWFAIAWAAGFFLFTLRLAADLVALRQWRSRSLDPADPTTEKILDDCRQKLGLDRRTRVRLHPDAMSPCIAGLFRPVIYLPSSSVIWPEATLRMVLLHELGHVARRDLWTNLASRFACLVYWFNPLVWWLRYRLMAQCEFACDAKVLAVGADPGCYATALCDVAESGAHAPSAALAMAGRASLRERVERVVGRRRAKHSLLVGAALLLTVSASLALSVVRVSPAELVFAGGPGSGDSREDLSGPWTPELVKERQSANPFPAD